VIFEATPIPGAFLVRLERLEDERGFFARAWCRDEFAARGIEVEMVQASVSFNRRAGTLRGMHYAKPPAREGKLVRCSRGTIHDVILDLRPDSPAFRRHAAWVLDDDAHDALYIPPGVAHGFQTLVDDCEILYMMTEAYRPQLAAGVRFDDPAFGIRWPLPVSVMAERDRSYPGFG
jgi:dTDP-4-dehydrorhamnose 3,5-epimerase